MWKLLYLTATYNLYHASFHRVCIDETYNDFSGAPVNVLACLALHQSIITNVNSVCPGMRVRQISECFLTCLMELFVHTVCRFISPVKDHTHVFTLILYIDILVEVTDGWTNRKTDREADRQTGRQADRQTDRQRFACTHKPAHYPTTKAFSMATQSRRIVWISNARWC